MKVNKSLLIVFLCAPIFLFSDINDADSDKFINIIIVKNGNVSLEEIQLVEEAINKTFSRYILDIYVLNESVADPPKDYPGYRYNTVFHVNQYLTASFYNAAEDLLRNKSLPVPLNETLIVLITDKHLYPGQGWNFVFGESIIRDLRISIVSTWFIKRRSADELDVFAEPDIYKRRLQYLAAHELGHSLTLAHVKYMECLMAFGASLPQLDLQIDKSFINDKIKLCDESKVRLRHAKEMIPCEDTYSKKKSFIRFRENIRIYPECMLRIYGNAMILFSILVACVYGFYGVLY